MKYSPMQQAIFDAVANTQDSLILNAVAGSGKTTTATNAVQYTGKHERVNAVVFNKKNVEPLEAKFSDLGLQDRTTVSTVHSYGYSAVRRAFGGVRVNDNKYSDGIKDAFDAHRTSSEDRDKQWIEIKNMLNAIRIHMIKLDADYINDSVARGFDVPYWAAEWCVEAIKRGMTADDIKINGVDFLDMIWLPVALNLPCTTYDFVVYDECQDSSLLQQHLAAKMRKDNTTRYLFVGDEMQSIYAFAGADSRSYARIQKDFNCKPMPLSVCYRCGYEIVEHVKSLVPHIASPEGQWAGSVQNKSEGDMFKLVKPGDTILCRTNAPLISACLSFLANGIKASVLGRDVGKNIAMAVSRIAKKHKSTAASWVHDVVSYYNGEVSKAVSQNKSDSYIDSLNNMQQCILAVSEANNTPDDVLNNISRIFTDTVSGITLSTGHKAKGLEWDNVFVLRPDLLCKRRDGQSPEAFQQEKNLAYVIGTRAKHNLTYLV